MRLPDFAPEEWLLVGLMGLCLAILFAGAFALVIPPAMPNAIDLSAFKCTDMRAETNTIMMPSGKTLVPMTITENVCHQWTAK